MPKEAYVSWSFADYRPITAVTSIAKVFEYYVLNKVLHCARPSDLQLGFT